MTAAPTTPRTDGPLDVRWTGREVVVRAPRDLASSADADETVRRFLARVLVVEAVASVQIDRTHAIGRIRPRTPADPEGFLKALAEAMRSEPSNVSALPCGPAISYTLHRNNGRPSTCEIVVDQPGWIRLRHPRLRSDRLAARDCTRRIAAEPNVAHVGVETRTGTLNIRIRDRGEANRILELVEEALDGVGWWDREAPPPARTSFAIQNASLAVGAAADLALPALGPVSAALLVAGNVKTFRLALGELREGKAGLPLLYTVIVGGTLASGNFLASSLMSWSFQYWRDRLDVDLSAGRRRLLEECLPLPTTVRIDRPTGLAVEPADRLRSGDRVPLGAGDPIPADGRVAHGRGLVDHRSVQGLQGVTRVEAGDELLAGGRVLFGSLTLEVTRPSIGAKAAFIGRSLLAATNPEPGTTAPAARAEAFAARTVTPTLAAAGVGFLAGGLDVAAAVLRPDYATGPSVAGPLENLRDAAACARIGVIVQSPGAFERLARVDQVVLDDFPGLHRRGVQVATIQTDLPEALLLQSAASAFRYMADDRAAALEDACRARGSVLLDLAPIGFDDGVTVLQGRRRINVRDRGAVGTGPLSVEIDGLEVGRITFARASEPLAARAVVRLRRRTGLPVTLLSHRSADATARLARELGVDAAHGGLSSDAKAGFLRSLPSKRLALFIGDCTVEAQAARAAFAAVCTTGDSAPEQRDASVVLMRPDLELLAEALTTAREHDESDRSARRFVLVPGALCVAGAMFLGVTSLAVVAVNNLGTLQLYRRAAGPLRAVRPMSTKDRLA